MIRDCLSVSEGNIISNNGKEEVIDLGEEEMTSSSYTEDLTDATNTLMATPTGTTIYDYSTNGYGYLYDGGYVTATSTTRITAGSKIRVYGVSIDDWVIKCVGQTKTENNASGYTANGYVEFDVKGNWGLSLNITGKNFTITYVTLVNGKSESVIWNTETVFNDWNATIVIDANQFTNAKAGDIVRVYVKDKTSEYNPIFKHVDDWSDWTGFQNSINKDNNEYFQAPIPSDGLNELKSKGLRFQGVGFTVTNIVLIPV